jgi:hypothetical protein
MYKTIHKAIGLSVGIFLMSFQSAHCSDRNLSYIAQYKDLAVHEQYMTGIPASIKLAMALLESGSGRSYLAVNGNNHFGIKWWNATNDGAAFIETFDDDKDRRGRLIVSRFIKFNSVEASYRKHSEVLLRPRYQILFTYLITDYRSWAYGLERCGYATAHGYGLKLIQLIEQYQLTQYDASPDLIPEVIVYEASPTVVPKQVPQYKSVLATTIPSLTHSPPIYSSKTVVESRFINNKGQAMHYTLSEVGEEVLPKK